MIQKLNCGNNAEIQDIGKKAYQELNKVVPSFIRRAESAHKHQKTFCLFTEQMEADLKTLSQQHDSFLDKMDVPGIKLICYDPDSPYRVAAALLFHQTDVGLLELQEYCRKLPDDELARILEAASQCRKTAVINLLALSNMRHLHSKCWLILASTEIFSVTACSHKSGSL